jgi:hypothetical protein
MRSMVEGASQVPLHCHRKRVGVADAPSTILRAARYGWSPSPTAWGRMKYARRVSRPFPPIKSGVAGGGKERRPLRADGEAG